MGKKALVLFFAFLLSINSFAAVVSDNDGSAFVTKAEFEALKKDFADQIINYNDSIDGKIDGAIAYYLAGKRMSKKEIVKLDSTFEWSFPIICMNNGEWNDKNSSYYSYELPNDSVVGLYTRSGDWEKAAAGLAWNSTSYPSCGDASHTGDAAVAFGKSWVESKPIYNEMLEISDDKISRNVGGSSYECYKLSNVGKGRHKVSRFTHSGQVNAGNVQQLSKNYWGYSGIIGMGVNNAKAGRNQMTTSTFANWTPGIWTRKGGSTMWGSLGWGSQTSRAFVLPADGLNINGARNWGATYTSCSLNDNPHGTGNASARADAADLELSITWKDDNASVRNWTFTGNSNAPATSKYGWYFNFQKPNNATDPFEGYIMTYINDIALASVGSGTWAGFHSWAPGWYWRYTAGGTIDTNPSTSEFSILPAKQIYYYDNDNKLHFMDEGMFLFNMPGVSESVEFNAKWEVLDSTVTTEQKIELLISSTPFDQDHDNSKNLKFSIDDGTESYNHQVVCGNSSKIKVVTDENVKQLYMMWKPVTSGTYLGLTELSDFTVALEQ